MAESGKCSRMPENRHFSLEKLAPGVYAAINRQDGWAIGNAGIVDLGDSTLVFDTTLTPASASELRASAEYLTGRPVSIVINSHYHNDHTWGNMEFAPESLILSSTTTRNQILDQGKEEYLFYKTFASQQRADLQRQYEDSKDERSRAAVKSWLVYHQAIHKNLRKIRRIVPSMTFDQQFCLCGFDRQIELLAFENGHTQSDVILYLPTEGVIFMADLLCVGFHPYLEECDPKSLIAILGKIADMDAESFVPGHGKTGSREDLVCLEEYVRRVDHLARQHLCSGCPVEALDEVKVPREFEGWDYRQSFGKNLKAAYFRLINEN
jgi:cyclase